MAATTNDGSLVAQVFGRIHDRGEGWVFVPRDFLDLGDRGAVDVTLHRLVSSGKIRRLARGLYDYPRIHPRVGRLTPTTDEVADALARSGRQTVVRSDAMAASMLGLTTQVPARPVYLTNGATRSVRVGNQTIRFKHAAPSRLVGCDTKAGMTLRALRFLGKDGIDDATLTRLRSGLDDADRRELHALLSDAPAWMHSVIDRILSMPGTPTQP